MGAGGVLTSFVFCVFCLQRISQRVVRTSLEEQLDPLGPIASPGGPYQYF